MSYCVARCCSAIPHFGVFISLFYVFNQVTGMNPGFERHICFRSGDDRLAQSSHVTGLLQEVNINFRFHSIH